MRNRIYALTVAIGVLAVVLLGCGGLGQRVADVTATPTKTPRPTYTATVPATDTPVPTDIGSATPAAPTITPLPPTDTPALQPTEVVTAVVPGNTPEPPTETPTTVPPTQTRAPAAPTATRKPAVPTNTPAPRWDFKVTEQRIVPKQLNEAGLHSFFIRVIDAAGNPLHGVVVWDPTHPGQEARTGDKPDPYSAEYQMWTTDAYYLEVKDFRSEKTKALSTDRPKVSNQDLIDAGYCTSNQDCDQNVHIMHFSWYVTFQRTW